MQSVLIIGSGPNARQSVHWHGYDYIVVINNAWQIRFDWDFMIFPDDFPKASLPKKIDPRQKFIRSADYVPVQNGFGGFVYAGGTMAFTAAYWALGALHPDVIAMIGCDMVYPPEGDTHFYGKGSADPLRDDISLRSLAAKSARLMAIAANEGCAMLNLSSDPSQLTFPRAHPETAAAQKPMQHNATAVAAALAQEAKLGYVVPSGKYWKETKRFDPDEIDRLDATWLALNPLAQSNPTGRSRALRQGD